MMITKFRSLAALLAILAMVAGYTYAATHNNEPSPSDEMREKGQNGKGHHNHVSGKNLVGDKIKKEGKSKFHEHGNYSAFVNVSGGKIKGVNVNHADKGNVPVTKYKTTKNMAALATSESPLGSLVPVQSQDMGTVWIGYGYIDEYGDEYIYWFPYEMIYDGDTGAIDYYPAW